MSDTFHLSDLELLLQARLVDSATRGAEMFKHANDVDILAITLMGEGRGEPMDGRAAIAWTVRNRSFTKGKTIAERCLQKLQYSCWWVQGGAYNYRRVMDLAEGVFKNTGVAEADRASFIECKYIAAGVISGQIRDKSKGSTHYCTTALLRVATPKWAIDQTPAVVIGAHTFFKDIPWS
jgi:hypothetical protein